MNSMNNRFFWVILMLGAALLGTGWILQSQEPPGSEVDPAGLASAPVAGYLAPDFTLTLVNGESITLSDLRGTPVVLNFWATWCPPCRAEIPHFQAASRKYNGQVIVAGVDDGEPLATVSPFVSEMGMTYPILLDLDSAVAIRYRVSALPTTFFIDADGVIQEVYPGIINQAVLESRIEQLIRGEEAAGG